MANAYDNSREYFKAVRALLRDVHDWYEETGSPRTGEVREQLESLSSKVFRVAVVATTSTGKSTFVNALLGLELMPMADEAKTALPVRVRPCGLSTKPMLRVQYRDGTPEECSPIDIGNTGPVLNRIGALMESGTAANVDRVELEVPIDAFRDFVGQDLPQVELIDTPGPSTQGLRDHREQALRAIDEAHAVIYLLDYKKPFQDSDAEILEQVRSVWERQGRLQRASRKLFFALNRADDRGEDSKQTPRERATFDREQALEVLALADLRPVVPVSAKAAMYGRLNMKGVSFDSRRRFVAGQIRASLKFWAAEDGNDELLAIQDPDLFMLTASGLPALEEVIYRYLVENALGELAAGALDTVISILKQDHKNTRRQVALWEEEGESISERIKHARRALDEFRARFRRENRAWEETAQAQARKKVGAQVEEFRQLATSAIGEAHIESVRVGGVWAALHKDLRDIRDRVNREKLEEYSSREAARQRQMDLSAEIARALAPHQGTLAVSVSHELRGLSASLNATHSVRVGEIARAVEEALGRHLGAAAAYPTEAFDLPPAPPLNSLDLCEIGISHSVVTKTQMKRVKYRPWYFLKLIELEKWVQTTGHVDVFTISLKDLFIGIQTSYRAALADWERTTCEQFGAAFIEPASRHYDSTSDRYVGAIEAALVDHERDRQRHTDGADRTRSLQSWCDRCAAVLKRSATLSSHGGRMT